MQSMKKFISFCIIVAVAYATANAQVSKQNCDYSHLYQNLPVEISKAALPQIPDNEVKLSDFGAVNDGITLCTDAFKQAIDSLTAKGGGHLVVTDGIWLTGPVTLQSNIDIHIMRNAIILMTPDKSQHKNPNKVKGSKSLVPAFYANKCHDISITGQGVIDGNGKYWRPVKRTKVSDTEQKEYNQLGGTANEKGDLWYPYNLKHIENLTQDPEKEANSRADLIRFEYCDRVLIQGIYAQNSPRFHVHPCSCKDVSIIGVTIRCPWNAQNGDALDLSNCQRCLITECTINAGDDGICMKGGTGESGVKNGPCKDILIENNTVLHAHGGFVIGSDVSGGMENIIVRNNRFMGTDTGLRFKSSNGRGGLSKNIFISNIVMTDIMNEAITFETTYANKQVGVDDKVGEASDFVPEFADIHIDSITCRGAKFGVTAHGEKSTIHDITVSNSTIFYNKEAKDIDDTVGITFDNVNFKTWE